MQTAEKLMVLMAEGEGLLVVSLVGSLGRSTLHELERSIEEIERRNPTRVILNYRDVSERIDRAVFGALGRLHATLRSRGAVLRVSSLHPSLRQALLAERVVKPEEMVNNLNEAF